LVSGTGPKMVGEGGRGLRSHTEGGVGRGEWM
jgi:hypothetical protein